MPATRKQEAKQKRFKQSDVMSDLENVMLSWKHIQEMNQVVLRMIGKLMRTLSPSDYSKILTQ